MTKKKATNSLAGDCPIWFFVFVFFFLTSVQDKSPCSFLSMRTSYRSYRIEVT